MFVSDKSIRYRCSPYFAKSFNVFAKKLNTDVEAQFTCTNSWFYSSLDYNSSVDHRVAKMFHITHNVYPSLDLTINIVYNDLTIKIVVDVCLL